MKIYFASDHAGFELKETLIGYVKRLGFEVEDCGVYKYDAKDDYPDFIKKAAAAVSDNPQRSLAIILGNSGEGEAIVANKFRHIRAVVYYATDPDIIRLSREHNGANVLSLGAGFLKEKEAKSAVKAWLMGHYVIHGRHKRRIEKINRIEHKNLWQRLFRL